MSIPPGTGRPVDDKWREWRLDELGEPTDITRLNANSRRHGLLPKLDGNAAHALLGDGSYGTPVGTVADGDKGDITVSDSGGTWTIDDGAVTYAKMQQVSETQKLLGRSNGEGPGPVSEISIGTGLGFDESGSLFVAANLQSVEDDGVPITARPTINFTGDGVTASDSGGKTVVNIPGGATDLSYTAATRIIASSTGADATLPLVSSGDAGLAPASGGGTANYLRADGTWTAPSAVVAISTASVAFTDGDTARRVTISDAAVSATSKIICSVMRPTSADDSADKGYVYDANVVRRAAGAFDVFMRCTDIGGDDCTANPPNETLTLCYQVA